MTIIRMVSAVSTPLHSCCTSSLPNMQSHTLSVSAVSCPNSQALRFSTFVSQFGYSSWNGLKHVGISVSAKFVALERKKRSNMISASLFGVGAPEALVIGVVALLVFGPKGLAEVARNLGKTLREFQPTIRELQDVSREFKSTLEREIGLDDISSNASRNSYRTDVRNTASTSSSVSAPDNTQIAEGPNGIPLQNAAYSNEESLEITEEQLKSTSTQQQQPLETAATSDDLLRITEEELKAAASQQQQPLETTAYTSEELLKITEEQLKAAASQQQQQTPLSSRDTTSS